MGGFRTEKWLPSWSASSVDSHRPLHVRAPRDWRDWRPPCGAMRTRGRARACHGALAGRSRAQSSRAVRERLGLLPSTALRVTSPCALESPWRSGAVRCARRGSRRARAETPSRLGPPSPSAPLPRATAVWGSACRAPSISTPVSQDLRCSKPPSRTLREGWLSASFVQQESTREPGLLSKCLRMAAMT